MNYVSAIVIYFQFLAVGFLVAFGIGSIIWLNIDTQSPQYVLAGS